MTARIQPRATPGIVYVLDGDESVRRGLSRLLRSAHLEARTYGSAEVFLDEVRSLPNSCMLMDLTVSHMTGNKVMLTLRERGIHLPVIVLSAREEDEFRQSAKEFGALLFLRKPVDDRALIDAINWVTENSNPPADQHESVGE